MSTFHHLGPLFCHLIPALSTSLALEHSYIEHVLQQLGIHVNAQHVLTH